MKYRYGFIGFGNMAEAIARGLVSRDPELAEEIAVIDVAAARCEYGRAQFGFSIAADTAELVRESGLVILAVKPGQIDDALSGVDASLWTDSVLLSICAGVSTARLAERVGNNVPVVRVMPNTPALVGVGACALYFAAGVATQTRLEVLEIFNALGRAVEVPSEALMDAVTGLSGSGPAYIYLAIEALADGAVREGLPRALAQELAAQTVKGAAEMVLRTGEHPGALKDKVTSPGGTTAEALAALETGGFRGLLIGAVEAAAKKSRALSG